MLVLTRRVSEEANTPSHQLALRVPETSRERVELGGTAPAEVWIHHNGCGHQGRIGEVPASAGQSAPLRVLIADSDASLLESYREYLDGHGFKVAVVANGIDCVAMLREFLPQVLVLEPSLSWGGGDGVLAIMDEQHLNYIPVVVLTYGRDSGALYRLAPYRIADYLLKPQSPRRLAERIKALVSRQPGEGLLRGMAID